MALPASGPISSSMIAAEFSSSQAPSGPNISLKGLASELSTPVTSDIFMGASFYGQSAGVTVYSFTGSELEESPTAACTIEEPENTWYHDGGPYEPAQGDTVYSDSPGTTKPGAGSILFVNNIGQRKSLNLDSSSEIISIANCR
jgi:hypothetical protein